MLSVVDNISYILFVHFFFFVAKKKADCERRVKSIAAGQCSGTRKTRTTKQRKRTKREKHAIVFCAAYGIALTEWMFVPFALQTKSLSAAKDNAAHLLLPLLGEGWDGEFFNIRFFGLKPSE